MRIRVLFFAQTRERVGRAEADLELPDGSRLADARAALRREFPDLEPLWPHLALAVNGRVASADTALTGGCELALLPPVSGG